MTIKIPIKKRRKKLTCGIVSLQAVMGYFGDKIPFEELLNQIKIYKDRPGTWMADEGKVALKYGYRVFLGHHNSYVLNKDTENLSEKDLAKLESYLNEIKKGKYKEPRRKAREIRKDIELIKRGGKFSTEVPTLNLIDKYLRKKIPVIISLSNNSLRGDPDRRTAHCVIVLGKEKNYYVVNDPLLEYKRPYKIEKNKLLHAWYLSGGYILVIQK